MTKFLNAILFCAYLSTVPAANYMIGHIGTICVPSGPCLIPVGGGLMAPSGVLLIGAALVLRDAVQQQLGIRWAVLAISVGAALSAVFAPPALVMASVLAFALAELADLVVYTPLRRRNLGFAVLASGLVGAAADSAIFLWVAFGSLEFMAGQFVGKMWMVIIASLAIWLWRIVPPRAEASGE